MHSKVQFGSGSEGCRGWLSFDASPTLRLQRLPLLGALAKRLVPPVFDADVVYGDGRHMPLETGSVELLYCSHVLEHLSLEDFRLTLRECRRVLKPGGVFRGVMPDMETWLAPYLNSTEDDACEKLWTRSYMASLSRPHGLGARLRDMFGNSKHLWLWDFKATRAELVAAGFVDVRRAQFNDSKYTDFKDIEVRDRWENELGFECYAPASAAAAGEKRLAAE
jgi:predicted SAM-dependent methyltransferase